jgi:hypothetical protein
VTHCGGREDLGYFLLARPPGHCPGLWWRWFSFRVPQPALKEKDKTLAKVLILEGLLPICAGCKGIQDKGGN